MEQEQRDALQTSLHDICEDLEAKDVLPYLLAKGIIQYGQADEIRVFPRQDERAIHLIRIVTAAGSLAFKEFINALQIKNKGFLADKILANLPSCSAQQSGLHELHHTTQESLKQTYLARFRRVYPFSLPFTFDIENTWVSLALKESYLKTSQPTQDHTNLLKRVFEKGAETESKNNEEVKMLIIEGDPATGKTSLMRRLAYEWAQGKEELLRYNLVVYAEFREVREQTFIYIADLVLYYSKKYLEEENFKRLEQNIKDRVFCKMHPILILLDGYDESSLEQQCSELSTFLSGKTIDNLLLFNIVITTRKGYLSNLRKYRGRYVFADVLGFTTNEQKKKYIDNHFSSVDNSAENIKAIHNLLKNNKNLDKLAETPLFLTFICLVHERIIDGTLVELYGHILWWLIDRHQKDFPERNIPYLFGFQTNSQDKFRTIQDHFLEFPQLYSLGKMAFNNLKKNIFQQSDYHQFDLKLIIEHAGLLRKDEFFDKSYRLTTAFFFPHRTIQEFLAALYYFNQDENTNQQFPTTSEMDTYKANEYEKFLLRIALSKHMPINKSKQTVYFETIRKLSLDLTLDVINTTTGFNNELLNWFISQCTNIQIVEFNKTSTGFEPQIPVYILLSFIDLTHLNSMTFNNCIIESNSQISFTNCPFLKTLKIERCEIKNSASIRFSKLPALDTLQFYRCTIDVKAWQSITGEIARSSVKQLKLTFQEDFNNEFVNHLQKCNNVEKVEITIDNYNISKDNNLLSLNNLINLHSLVFIKCILENNSQISFTNCPSLKTLKLERCEIKNSADMEISKLPALDTLQFNTCTIDLDALQSITDEIIRSSVKQLKLAFGKGFNNEFLSRLQKCNSVEEIETSNYNISKDKLLSLNDLVNLHSLIFRNSTFEANSQISLTNCPSLDTLKFIGCEIKSSASIDFSKLPALDTLEFNGRTIDLSAWQLITEEITRSSVKQLKLIFEKDFSNQFLNHLKKCNNAEKIEVEIRNYNNSKDNLSLNDLINLHSLKFRDSTFEANSQVSFKNCSSLRTLVFVQCEIKSSATIGFSKLSALDTLELYNCTTDLNEWQSITDKIRSSSVKQLRLSSDFFTKVENLHLVIQLQNSQCIEEIETYIYRARSNEEQLTTNLSNLARGMKGLKSITFDNIGESMNYTNMNIVEKAGQERDPNFKICLKLSSYFFAKEIFPESFILLQKCEWIEKIKVFIFHNLPDEEQLTVNLCSLAREKKGLKSITFDTEGKRIKNTNMEIIKKAGQERDPDFRTIFAKETEENDDPQGRITEVKRAEKGETRKRKRPSSSP